MVLCINLMMLIMKRLAARSIAGLTRAAGFKVIVVNRPSKKVVGINAVRTIFELCVFDEEKTKDGWQCLSSYAYKVNEETGIFQESLTMIHLGATVLTLSRHLHYPYGLKMILKKLKCSETGWGLNLQYLINLELG
jgi:hypothetical protein